MGSLGTKAFKCMSPLRVGVNLKKSSGSPREGLDLQRAEGFHNLYTPNRMGFMIQT